MCALRAMRCAKEKQNAPEDRSEKGNPPPAPALGENSPAFGGSPGLTLG